MEKYRKILLLSLKIGVGNSIAIYVAQALHLEYDVSAGRGAFKAASSLPIIFEFL